MENYINGNVVSRMSKRYNMNLVAATTSPVIDVPGDSSDDSGDDDIDPSTLGVGRMASVSQMINGILARSDDDGRDGLVWHGASVILGRSL